MQELGKQDLRSLRRALWAVARKFAAGSLVSVLMAGTVFGAGETVTIPIEDYHAILNRLDALQQRVEFLEAKPVAVPVDER
jgi:hypothetical protein